MQYFRGATAGEVILVRFDAGEDLLDSLTRFVRELELGAAAIVSGSGTLEHLNLHVPANMLYPPTIYAVEKQGPAQIVAAQGLIAGGVPELYLTLARRTEIHAGRCAEGTRVLHTVELTLLRAGNQRWVRVGHPQTGIPQIQTAGEVPLRQVTLMGRAIDPAAVAAVPRAILERHRCLPVVISQDILVVAMLDPGDLAAVDDIRQASGLRVKPVAVPANELLPALQQILRG